jgi:hypothetical protein
MNIDLQKNFNNIYNTLLNQGIKRTAFAKGKGFSSTSQLAPNARKFAPKQKSPPVNKEVGNGCWSVAECN